MADQAVESEVYVYRGGRAPQHITHAIIDKSVTEIDDSAFSGNTNLRSVKTHDGLKTILGVETFYGCTSLTHIDISSVEEIECWVFQGAGLIEVDCDSLLEVGRSAFEDCQSLRRISLPRVKVIWEWAFHDTALTEVELPEVEKIKHNAFHSNKSLWRIAIPLNPNLFDLTREDFTWDELEDGIDPEDLKDTVFDGCDNLVQVDLVGGIHETVSSLHLESWRNEMNNEINKINQVLPRIAPDEKTVTIRWWMGSVSSKVEHYKGEHRRVLKETATILELYLWKVNLLEENEEESHKPKSKRAKIDVERARKEKRIRSGADIVIKNVLPFLELK